MFGAIGNFVENFKFTYVEVDISTECTFDSTTFCEKDKRNNEAMLECCWSRLMCHL